MMTMNAPARQVLKALMADKTSEWVLPSVSSARQPISKAGIEAAWQRIRTAAQLDGGTIELHLYGSAATYLQYRRAVRASAGRR